MASPICQTMSAAGLTKEAISAVLQMDIAQLEALLEM